ncbi:MAG: family 43 glycosylhydrolase [Anaerolineae bacterium]
MGRRTRFFLFLVCCLILIAVVGTAHTQSDIATGDAQAGMLRNPLNYNNGADPWLTYYNGSYYLAATTWASSWTMRQSTTLAGLKTAEPQTIYAETDPSRGYNFWAPEFRLLNGPDGLHWYFYYTAGTFGTYDNQRIHVLESEGTDPMGPYTYKARLFDPFNDFWMIDGSLLELDGALYFLFSSFADGLQSLFIAPMSNPWTISGERVLISQPTYPWETVGGFVNEGPVTLQHNGRLFLIYSASSCNTPDYKLGMLTYTGDNPLDPASWVKSPEPVFQRADQNGVYAPGHNGFFQSPDGTEDWLVYHANDSASYGCDGRRSTRVQRIHWNEDGAPDFGIPESTQTEIAAPSGDMGIDPLPEFTPPQISNFRTFAEPYEYLRHSSFQLRMDFNPSADSQFVVRPGLADNSAISIESVNFPGFYLRQQDNVVWLSADDQSETYAADATWWVRPGLADTAGLSLESYSRPGFFIGRRFGVTALVDQTAMNDRMRHDATFAEEH